MADVSKTTLICVIPPASVAQSDRNFDVNFDCWVIYIGEHRSLREIALLQGEGGAYLVFRFGSSRAVEQLMHDGIFHELLQPMTRPRLLELKDDMSIIPPEYNTLRRNKFE